MKTQDTDEPLDALRCLCRYETHGGYVWAGVGIRWNKEGEAP